MAGDLVIRGGNVLDVGSGEYAEASDVRIEAGSVVELGRNLAVPDDVPALDASGRYVVPGLIDAHVHVTAVTADLSGLASWSPTYVTAHAARIMAGMLARGFTAVRDVAGADFGLAAAQAEGLLSGPRLYFGGKALSQTGGHGDGRRPGQHAADDHPCTPALNRVVDGVDAARRAAREELRTGAHHLKVMTSGGIASPTDRIDSTQYSDAELAAIVAEAHAANRYVAAHAYTARAVAHALHAGVRTIEHGNLIDDESIELLLRSDAFLVPTLVTYQALASEGQAHGLPAASQAKVADVLEAGLGALDRAARAGVRIAFGTDLLGGMHRHQAREFRIRADVVTPLDVLRHATVVGAELLGETGRLGVLAPGALGDALVLNADPVADAGVLAEPQEHLLAVVQAGAIVA